MRDLLIVGTACTILVAFLVAVVSVHLMRMAANARLSEDEKISYFLPLHKWDRIVNSYRRLYPQGRLYPVLRVAVIGTAILAAAAVFGDIWFELVAK
jgi:hypothetical protein